MSANAARTVSSGAVSGASFSRSTSVVRSVLSSRSNSSCQAAAATTTAAPTCAPCSPIGRCAAPLDRSSMWLTRCSMPDRQAVPPDTPVAMPRIASALVSRAVASVERPSSADQSATPDPTSSRIWIGAGWKEVSTPAQLGQQPVGGCGEHRGELTEPGHVHRRGCLVDGGHVGDDDVRPAGRCGPLDAVAQQHRDVVGEAVDRRRGLDHHEGHAADRGRGDLSDVGDRSAADADHRIGADHRRSGLLDHRLGRMQLRVAVVQHHRADVELLLQRSLDRRLDLLVAAADRGAVHQQCDRRPVTDRRSEQFGDRRRHVRPVVRADSYRPHPASGQDSVRIGLADDAAGDLDRVLVDLRSRRSVDRRFPDRPCVDMSGHR